MAIYQKSPPRPRKQSKLVAKLQSFADGIAQDPARYHLGEAESAEISHAVEAFVKAMRLATGVGTKTKSTVRDKDQKRRIAETVHSKYYNLIKNDPGIPDGDKMAIGVRPVNLERTEIPVPTRCPKLAVVGVTTGRHTLKFADDGDPMPGAKAPLGGKGKPHGAAFIQLYAAVGQGKDQSRDDAREVGLFTRNPIRVSYEENDNGKQACYWARWISPKGEPGPWSIVTSMAVAA